MGSLNTAAAQGGRGQGASVLQASLRSRAEHYFRHHREMARDALRRLADTPFSSLLTTLVLAISLALPTGLFSVLKNLQTVAAGWTDEQVKVSVFLKKDLKDSDIERLYHQLLKREDVMQAELISRSQALAEFKKWSGFSNVLEGLDENPLPAVLVVQPRDVSVNGAKALRDALGALPQSDSVQLDTEWIQRLQAMVALMQRLVGAFALALAVTVLLVIGNTIRLAIEGRRDEIVVVKLVGGTNAFVRRPFLYTGLWYGFAGAFLALAMVESLTAWLRTPARELAQLYGSDFVLQGLSLSEGGIVFTVGVMLGLLGAMLAVRQHLRAIEPHGSI
ncbi:Cell division protein FtsX [gamma proteobacterium HdN1]|nr:Cell division protein FtsX [gamma proteobacterium HdN1]